MKAAWVVSLIVLYSMASVVRGASPEWQRGYKTGEVYGAIFGQMIGTVYGVSISSEDGTFCLNGTEEEKLIKIKEAIEENAKTAKLGYVPNRQNSLAFLRTHFPCS